MKQLLTTGLSPYSGTWEKSQAAHLLRRATFGASYEQIREIELLGLEMAVDVLLSELPLPEPPLNYFHDKDLNAPIGTSWILAPYPNDGSGGFQRRHSLDAWILGRLISGELSIREKMVLFWHNHFAIEKGIVADAKYLYKYSTLLRENALSNFKQLVKDMTIDPAMLYYLNGRDNTKNNPNENYARELLELFTIGKGDIAGPGDYTTFTEQDVIEIARVLTGWRDSGRFNRNDTEISSDFRSGQHDTNSKQLSHRFGEAHIEAAGAEEYSNLIDIIFEQEEVAHFICRKLYRWFVNFEISQEIENQVIQPMARILIEHEFEILPVMRALLMSEHFYDELVSGAIIKNPLEFFGAVFNGFKVEVPEDFVDWYRAMKNLSRFLEEMQMTYFSPPSVAGWEAFYLEPQYYKQWINSVTLRPRREFTDKLSQNGLKFSTAVFQIDVLQIIAEFDNPGDPNELILDLAVLLFPQAPSQTQIDYLKNILIPGLPDFEWTLEYGLYLEDPENGETRRSVETRLRNMLQAMLSFPEFYTN